MYPTGRAILDSETFSSCLPIYKLAMKVFLLMCLMAQTAAQANQNLPAGSGSKIVGGTQAEKCDWPSIILLKYNGNFICAGTIINKSWIVTAAHCIVSFKANRFKVVVGEYDRNLEEDEVNYNVIRLVRHGSYNAQTNDFDIALIKVASDIAYNSCIQPVVLTTSKFDSDKTYKVIGWGDTSEGGSPSNVLQEVEVPGTTQKQCKVAYGRNSITRRMICAGATGKDSCQGDSGGPLMYDDGNGEKELVGIVSWGIGCGQEGYPGVYTNVFVLRKWINNKVKN